MKILVKIVFTLGYLAIIVPLWLIGFSSMSEAVKQGHFPMYEMAVFLECPEWVPLLTSVATVSIMWYTIVWRGIVRPIIMGSHDRDQE